MAISKSEILDAVAALSVLELSELIKDMEEKFGVSAAAAAVAVAAAPAAGAGAHAADDVVLRPAPNAGRRADGARGAAAGSTVLIHSNP